MFATERNPDPVVVSPRAEATILSLIEIFHIQEKSCYGFDADSDNGLQDLSYATKHAPLLAEQFPLAAIVTAPALSPLTAVRMC